MIRPRTTSTPLHKWFVGKENVPFIPRDFAWCWKRDGANYSRSVYYLPRFEIHEEGFVNLQSVDFYYEHLGPPAEMVALYEAVAPHVGDDLTAKLLDDVTKGRQKLILRSPTLSPRALSDVVQLLAQQPRTFIPRGNYPAPTIEVFTDPDQSACFCGSGVSYEAGLPTLADIHELFGVDDRQRGRFNFGVNDPLPPLLAHGVSEYFSKVFASFHIASAMAHPTDVHIRLATAQKDGNLLQLISDNLDYLFEKAGARPTRVRSTFPKSHYVDLDTRAKALLVIGVAADRRLIIAQARKQNIPIVCVNPEEAVSPSAQNLSYLSPSDRWYRMRASTFFRDFIDAKFGSRA